MRLRFDSPASASNLIFDAGEYLFGVVTGGGQIVANGRHAGTTTLTITGAGLVAAKGGGDSRRFDSPIYVGGYLFDRDDTQSPGSAITISGGGQVVCNGGAGSVQAAYVTARPGLTVSGGKNAVGTWFVEYWVHLTTSGRKDAKGQAVVTGGGELSGFGYPGFTARLRGGGTVTVTPSKGAAGTSSLTAGGQVSAAGTAVVIPVTGQASVTAGGTVAAVGTKSSIIKTGGASISGGGGPLVTGTGARLKRPAVVGGGSVTVSASKAAEGTATITGGGQVISYKPSPVKATVWLLVEPAA